MKFVGVDIGKFEHAVGIINGNGKPFDKPFTITQDANGFKMLEEQLEAWGGSQKLQVAMEATGQYWKLLFDRLISLDYQVGVINPLITAREASADVRGRKTDKLDALAIARAAWSRNYNGTVKEESKLEELRSLSRHRGRLVQQRSSVKLEYSCLLDTLFAEARTLFGDLYCTSALALFERFPSARLIAAANPKTLLSILQKASNNYYKIEFVRKLRALAKKSISVKHINTGSEFVLVQLIEQLRSFDAQVVDVEKRIKTYELPEVGKLLIQIKGAGDILPYLIAAEIGNLSKFEASNMNAKVLAYAGAEPRVRESGRWKGKTKMSKRGSGDLRHNLYNLATSIKLHTPYFKQVYDKQVLKGKCHRVAMSHVVRKIIDIMIGMHGNGTKYEPSVQGGNSDHEFS